MPNPQPTSAVIETSSYSESQSASAMGTVVGLWALLLGIGIIMLANGLQGTLLALRASLDGFSTATTGVVMAAYFVGMLVGSRLTSKLIEGVGHVRVFAALACLASVSVLVHGLFVDPITWALMRFVTGFCFAGLYVVTESWLNDLASNESRGRILSIYMVVVFLGMAGGQFLLMLADPRTIELFVLISALVSLAVVPILLTASKAPTVEIGEWISIRALYRASPLGLVSCIGTGVAHGTLFGMGAVFATQAGYDVNGTAWLMAAPLIGAVLFQFPIGRLSDRFDRRKVLTAVALGAMLASAMGIVYCTPEQGLGYLVMMGLGAMTLPLYALSIAHANDHFSRAQMVRASSTLVLACGMGTVFGPLIGALAMDRVGPSGFFVALTGIHAFIGLFALYRMTRRAPVPMSDQTMYVSAPQRGSPVAAALVAETVGEQRES